MKTRFVAACGVLAILAAAGIPAPAQTMPAMPTLTIAADRVKARIDPSFYGLMTEEINFSYEGGLYGELIRNRSFKAEAGYAYQAEDPVYWRTVGAAEIALDKKHKLNDALDLNLALTIKSASAQQPAGIVNAGYWGIALRPDTVYTVSFYAKAEGESGPLTVALAKAAWAAVTSATVQGVGTEWKKFELTLRVAPRTQTLRGIAKEFTLTLPAYSVAVLEFEVQ